MNYYRYTLFFLLAFLSFQSSEAQTPLNQIEKEVYMAYKESVDNQTDEFITIINRLDSIYQREKEDIYIYWVAYTKYSQALMWMNSKRDDVALKIIMSAIKSLEELKNSTSEDLTLQGSLMGLSISMRSNIAAVISAKAGKLYEKALELDDNNLRTYLSIARSDYYKPAQYGGGKKVESYLKKALTKPDKTSDHELAPTWGREDVYYFLASYYWRESRFEEAKLFCKKGLQLFPDSEALDALMKEIE